MADKLTKSPVPYHKAYPEKLAWWHSSASDPAVQGKHKLSCIWLLACVQLTLQVRQEDLRLPALSLNTPPLWFTGLLWYPVNPPLHLISSICDFKTASQNSVVSLTLSDLFNSLPVCLLLCEIWHAIWELKPVIKFGIKELWLATASNEGNQEYLANCSQWNGCRLWIYCFRVSSESVERHGYLHLCCWHCLQMLAKEET